MPTARMIVPCKAVNGTLLLIPCHRRKPPTNPSGTAIHGSSSAGFGGLSFIARLYRPSFFREAQFCGNLTFFHSLFESRLNFRFGQEKAQNGNHPLFGRTASGIHPDLYKLRVWLFPRIAGDSSSQFAKFGSEVCRGR